MQVRKAVITAAGRAQRNLPMQTLFDQQGTERSVLSLVVREAVRAGIDDICIVVWPGDEEPYAKLLSDDAARLTFVRQTEPRGYAHAIWCSQAFVREEPFLHFVGDHIYVSPESGGCARQLVELAIAKTAPFQGCRSRGRVFSPGTARSAYNRFQGSQESIASTGCWKSLPRLRRNST